MPDRRVRHLRLAARAESEVRRLLPRLEDALRCASLPDSGEQLFLVRRLALGRLPHDASPQTLALLLERRVAAAGGVWADGGSAAAAAADCVRFASRLDARVALALRLARGQATPEWYWRPAVPEYRPEAGPSDNLRRLASAIAGLPEARAALPAWVARLVEVGAGDALQIAIPAALGEALADRLGLPPAPGRRGAATRPATPEAAATQIEPPAWLVRLLAVLRPPSAVGQRWCRSARTTPARTPPSAAPRSTPPEQPDHTAATPHRPGHPATPAESRRHSPIEAVQPPGPLILPAPATQARPDRRPPATLESPPPAQPKTRPARPAAARQQDRPPARTEAAAVDPHPWLAPSAAGGLLFLLPVLARLGIAAWCDRPGLEDFPRRVLALAARRLRLPDDDPALAAFPIRPGNPRRRPLPAPASWSAPLLAPPRGRPAGDPVAALATARRLDDQAALFLTVARRWLRRAARLGLADLVLRPARVSVTTTHVDVHFRLVDCDIRVRRAGLDLDPGWLPWLGRVVSFHYEADGKA